jgi:hypothetical protein
MTTEPSVASPPPRRALWLLAASLFLATCVVSQPATGWNVNTRLDLVFAVVDHGELHIDRYHEAKETFTNDKAAYGGHVYSDKIIGLSLVAIPVYAVIRGVANLVDEEPDFQLTQFVATRLTVSLSAALAAVLMAILMMRMGGRPRRVIVTVAGVFYGSMLFGYSSVFYPYLPGIAACLGALLVVYSPPLTVRRAAAVGGLLGTALLFDLTFNIAVAVIGVLFVMALAKLPGAQRWRAVALATMAGAAPLLLFAAYSTHIFGKPTIPYTYEVSEYFREGMSNGVMGVTAPKAAPMWFLSFHPFRGIVFWSPWLLMTVVTAVSLIRRRHALRPIALASLATFVGYFLFNAGYYQWWGGSAMGPRLMIPMFAVVPLALVAACRDDAPWWMWRPLVATFAIAVVLTLPISMIDAQTSGGNSTDVLTNASFGTRLRTIQLEQWRDFFMFRWTDIKPQVGILNSVSFVLCLAFIIGGTIAAYRSAERREPSEAIDPATPGQLTP